MNPNYILLRPQQLPPPQRSAQPSLRLPVFFRPLNWWDTRVFKRARVPGPLSIHQRPPCLAQRPQLQRLPQPSADFPMPMSAVASKLRTRRTIENKTKIILFTAGRRVRAVVGMCEALLKKKCRRLRIQGSMFRTVRRCMCGSSVFFPHLKK